MTDIQQRVPSHDPAVREGLRRGRDISARGRRRTFAVLLFFGVIPTPAVVGASLPNVIPFNTVCLVLAAAVLVVLPVGQRGSLRLPFQGPLLLIAAAVVLGTVFGLTGTASLVRTGWGLLGVVNLLIGMTIGSFAVASARNLRLVTTVVVVATLLTAPAVLLSQLGIFDLFVARVQQVEGDAGLANRVVIGSAEVTFLFLVAAVAHWLRHRHLPRVVIVAAACGVYLLYATFARNLLFISVIAFAIVVVLLIPRGVNVLSSLVRAGLLGVFAALLAGVVLLLASPAVVDTIRVSVDGYISRVLDNPDFVPNGQNSWNYRLREVGGAVDLLRLNGWFFGSGLGSPYRVYFPNEDFKNFGDDGGVFFIHNALFWVWTKLGLIGVAGYVALIACALQRGLRSVYGDDDEAGRIIPDWLTIAATAALLGLLVRGLVTPSLAWGAGALTFGVILSIINASGRRASGSPR